MRSSTIVLGAGAGGLVAALYLQRAGHDVVLLEAKSRVGGCASAFPVNDFRFVAGATTLMGLPTPSRPELPQRQRRAVLPGREVPGGDGRVEAHVELAQHPRLTRDAAANDDALTRLHGPAFAKFWRDAATLGAKGWDLITRMHFPPRGPGDLLDAAGQGLAWRLPALLRSTAALLPDVSADARALLDELLPRDSTRQTRTSLGPRRCARRCRTARGRATHQHC